MIKYHIRNNLTRLIEDSERFEGLTEEEHIRLYTEVKNATLQGIDNRLCFNVLSKVKVDNDVNSLLLWVLGLTDQKPTGPQKIKSEGSYCDIDLDFSQQKRGKIFEYLAEKYGQDRVGHIATFGTMAAKGAIRNAARALGYSIELQNKVAKFIPDLPGVTIQDSIDANKEFQTLILTDAEVRHIVDVARKLEGLPNSIGMHASAGIISDVATTNHLPIMTATRKENAEIMSQFDMKDVESKGLLKYDKQNCRLIQ